MNENACIEYTRRPRPFTAIKQLVRNYVKYAAENRTFITVDCILLANRRQFALLKEIMGVRSVGQLAGGYSRQPWESLVFCTHKFSGSHSDYAYFSSNVEEN